jgi:Flp pilus assembly protein TadD
MAKPSRFGSAVSFAAFATVLSGCAASADKVSTASYREGKQAGDVGLATRAAAALSANDIPAAIDFAERAVAKTPDDAGFRGLLGNVYFAGGRFASAEEAYKDSLAIYPSQPKVILKLALVEIALGETDRAVAFLNHSREDLDAADYGLALALAGQAGEAVATLETAARAQDADGRVRQNLALAYAFTGDWAKARLVAAQDVPADQLDARIHQWMQLAKPAHAADQVAALTGVTPAATDPGQPVRLALRKSDALLAQATPEPSGPAVAEGTPIQQTAVAQPAVATPQFAEASPISQPDVVAPAPPPVDPARVAAKPEPVAPAAPAVVAAVALVAPEAPAAFAVMAAKFAPVPKPAKARRAPPPVRPAALRVAGKGPVMQLGAYKSPQYVNAAWSHLTQKYPALRSYLPLRARFDSPKGTFWRLSVQGFATERDALARCQLLKSRGGTCFVRGFAGDAPVQIASR